MEVTSMTAELKTKCAWCGGKIHASATAVPDGVSLWMHCLKCGAMPPGVASEVGESLTDALKRADRTIANYKGAE